MPFRQDAVVEQISFDQFAAGPARKMDDDLTAGGVGERFDAQAGGLGVLGDFQIHVKFAEGGGDAMETGCHAGLCP